ncbi:MAG TPA: LytTR family DNA-binding domain-containing protein [Rhodocyclaceae bacterium]|nr:LytTR family DNA-binding domain-containing protein [Rhodocyclaceae bacterium]
MPFEARTDVLSHGEPVVKETFQHKLEQFNPGMVWLDAENRVVALNDVAMQILGPTAEQTIGIGRGELIGIDVLKMHPEKSRDKLAFLLKSEDSPGCPVKSPPPMAMMINIPDRVLMIKVSKMLGNKGIMGICMVFYDLTEVTTVAPRESTAAVRPRILQKIPVYRKNRIVLVDLKNAVRFEGEGHYTSIETLDDRFLCNLSLSDLEERLNPEVFFRVHRSHIVNLNYVLEIERVDDNVAVIMNDKGRTHVSVSRNRVPQFKELLGLG